VRQEFKKHSILEAILHNGLRPTIPTSCPDFYKNLIQTCWQYSPEVRGSFKLISKEILEYTKQLNSKKDMINGKINGKINEEDKLFNETIGSKLKQIRQLEAQLQRAENELNSVTVPTKYSTSSKDESVIHITELMDQFTSNGHTKFWNEVMEQLLEEVEEDFAVNQCSLATKKLEVITDNYISSSWKLKQMNTEEYDRILKKLSEFWVMGEVNRFDASAGIWCKKFYYWGKLSNTNYFATAEEACLQSIKVFPDTPHR